MPERDKATKPCCIQLPDGTSCVVVVKPGLSIKEVLAGLCERHGINGAAVDLFLVGGDKVWGCVDPRGPAHGRVCWSGQLNLPGHRRLGCLRPSGWRLPLEPGPLPGALSAQTFAGLQRGLLWAAGFEAAICSAQLCIPGRSGGAQGRGLAPP